MVGTLNVQGSAAYDYSRFEEAKRPHIKEVSKHSSARAEGKIISVPKAVCCLLIALVLASALIYTRVVQTELSDQYNTTVLSLNAKKSENARLQLQLETAMSLVNIDKTAKENLGMSEIKNQQIEYVNFDTKDKAVVIEQHSFWNDVANWFQDLFR